MYRAVPIPRTSFQSTEDDSSVVLLEVRRGDIISNSATQRRNAVMNLYTGFKTSIFHILIGFFRSNYESFQENDVIMIIDNGKECGTSPHLDLNKGDTKTWSMEQTLRQYVEGVRGYSKKLINMPDFVVNETLRYLHTNTRTKGSAPMVINENTSFKPVLPNRIHYGEQAFVSLNKIFPKDIMFITSINRELKKFRPDLKIVIETVTGDGSEIDVNGNKLILCHNFTTLVIKKIDDDSSSVSLPVHSAVVSIPKQLPSQDDEISSSDSSNES
jgi:hypothetical protein